MNKISISVYHYILINPSNLLILTCFVLGVVSCELTVFSDMFKQRILALSHASFSYVHSVIVKRSQYHSII